MKWIHTICAMLFHMFVLVNCRKSRVEHVGWSWNHQQEHCNGPTLWEKWGQRSEKTPNDTRPQRLSPVSIGQLTFAFSLPTIFFLWLWKTCLEGEETATGLPCYLKAFQTPWMFIRTDEKRCTIPPPKSYNFPHCVLPIPPFSFLRAFTGITLLCGWMLNPISRSVIVTVFAEQF